MPPKSIKTESDLFKQAILEGKSAALSGKKDRDTAAPRHDEEERKSALFLDKNEDPANDAFAGGFKTPASGTIGSHQTVFRKPFLTTSDRQDILESRIEETNSAVSDIRSMLATLMKHLSPSMTPTASSSSAFLSSDRQPSSVSLSSDRQSSSALPSDRQPSSGFPSDRVVSASSDRQVRDFKEILRLVPNYEGKGADSLLQYIDTFEMYLTNARKCVDYHPEEIFYQASGRLKGDAWSEWRSNGKHIQDWEELKMFLTKRFISRQSIMDLSSSIHTTNQGKRSTQEYVTWFQKVAAQLNHFGQGIGEDLPAIGIFLRGVNNDHLLASLKSTLSTRPDMNLPDVLTLARELGPVFDPKKSAATTMTSSPKHGLFKKKGGDNNGGDACSVCGTTGHAASGCFTIEANRPEWYKKKLARRAEWLKKQGKDKGKDKGGSEKTKETGEQLSAYTTSLVGDGILTTDVKIVVDTGASNHMCPHREWFTEFAYIEPIPINTSNGAVIYALGRGSIRFEPSGFKTVEIRNVLYIPDLSHSLFSVSCLPPDVVFTVQGSICLFIRNGTVEMEGSRSSNGLFLLTGNIRFSSALTTSLSQSKSKSADVAVLWHNRLGHLNYAKLRYLLRMKYLDIPLDASFEEPPPCNACIKAKLARKPFHSSETRATRPLEVLHSDICGPLGPAMGFEIFDGTPLNDAYYFETLIDEYSRKVWVIPITRKCDAYGKTEEFIVFMKGRFPNSPIRTIRTDGGKEYDSAKFQALFRKHGIFHDTTTPYTPQQNGVAERLNRTLVESARAMLIQENLSLRCWSDAIVTAGQLHNILPRSKQPVTDQEEKKDGIVVKGTVVLKSPDEYFNDPSPHASLKIDSLRTFGVPAYVLIQKDAQGKKNTKDPIYGKFSAKADLRLFLGYVPNVKGYRFLDPEETNKASRITTSRDARFLESKRQESAELSRFLELVKHQKSSTSAPKVVLNTIDENRVVFYTIAELVKKQIPEPRSIAEAKRTKEWPYWKAAIEDELKSLDENETWELIPKSELPANKKCVNSRWVLKVKYHANGNIERYKARLVAQGFTQISGIDYNETFAPVVKFSSVRIIIALAVKRNLRISQFDIKTAFLRGNLEEIIYMRLPKGFEILDEAGEEQLCLLLKALYGLKQSARCLYTKIDNLILAKGFKRLESDHSVYIKGDTIVAIYVDDIIVVGDDSIKTDLAKEFDIKDLGRAKYILGIELDYTESTKERQVIILRQSKYIYEILHRFNMLECKPVATPMDPGIETSGEAGNELTSEPYNELVGSLIFLIQCTRPDIAFAVGMLSRHLKNPTHRDWERAKRVLRYLKGTIGYGIKYQTDQEEELVVYSDADYAADTETRCSTTGYLSMLAGGPITWKSQLQKTVALSTMEAEYMAVSAAVQETIWLRRLLKELGEQDGASPTTVYCDNQSAICFTKNPVQHQRSKHIDVRYHFARQAQEENVVAVKYLPTEQMVADPLTKPCNKEKAKVLTRLLDRGKKDEIKLEGEC